MHPPPVNAFAREFRSLSSRERYAFLAAVWEARGYETCVRGGTVIAQGDRVIRIDVVGPLPWQTANPDADVLVGTHDTRWTRVRAERHGATFLPPARIHDLLWYGVDRPIATSIARAHLDDTTTSVRDRLPSTDWIPPSRLTSTHLVVVLLLIAGVIGIGVVVSDAGVGGAAEPIEVATDRPVAAETISSHVDNGPPPGLSDDGVDDVGTLVAVHQIRTSGSSQTVNVTYEGPSAWLFMDSTRLESSLRLHSERNYHHSVERTIERENETITVLTEEYRSGDATYVRSQRRNESGVAYASTDTQINRAPHPVRSIPRMIARDALTANRTDVEAVSRAEGTAYRVTAAGNSTEFTRGQFQRQTGAFETTAHFTPDGRLLDLTVQYTDAHTGDPATIRVTYDDFGTTERIEPPPWTDRQTNASNP